MEVTLECKTRPVDSKPNALRRSGLVPAVLYGHNGVESVSIAMKAKDAEHLLRDAAVNSTLVNLNVADLPWKGKALLREVQTHPAKGTLYHISFFSIGSQSELDVDIPIHVVGEAPGVKTGGGSLDLQMNELRVRCAPDSIPEVINIDVSELTVGDALHVHELDLPNGVTTLVDKDQVVVMISGPRVSSGGDSEEEESTEETV